MIEYTISTFLLIFHVLVDFGNFFSHKSHTGTEHIIHFKHVTTLATQGNPGVI